MFRAFAYNHAACVLSVVNHPMVTELLYNQSWNLDKYWRVICTWKGLLHPVLQFIWKKIMYTSYIDRNTKFFGVFLDISWNTESKSPWFWYSCVIWFCISVFFQNSNKRFRISVYLSKIHNRMDNFFYKYNEIATGVAHFHVPKSNEKIPKSIQLCIYLILQLIHLNFNRHSLKTEENMWKSKMIISRMKVTIIKPKKESRATNTVTREVNTRATNIRWAFCFRWTQEASVERVC